VSLGLTEGRRHHPNHPKGGIPLKVLTQILMAAAGISLILAILMGFDIIKSDILNVSGRGFIELSMGCSLYAIGLTIAKPFGGDGAGE
jgi:hypothetical protein